MSFKLKINMTGDGAANFCESCSVPDAICICFRSSGLVLQERGKIRARTIIGLTRSSMGKEEN
jgi:hypothetical protein